MAMVLNGLGFANQRLYLLPHFSTQHLLGDSALFCAETLKLMKGIIWTSRVPETLLQARDLMKALADDLASANDGEQPNFNSVDVTYADIEQQWIVVYSPHFTYRLCGSLASDYQQYQQRLKRKSCFILATNQTDKELMDGHQILADYKNRQKVERGFRFLKDPMFLASSVFLKSPKRIMALTMVMTVCLLVYAALEHRMRKSLADSDSSFPNQTGKMINNPTIRWVFQYFQNIPVIYLQQTKAAVLNINAHHQKLLQLMGKRYLRLYS